MKKILFLTLLLVSSFSYAQSVNKECSLLINTSYKNREQIILTISKIKSSLLQSDWINEENKTLVNNQISIISQDIKNIFPAKNFINDTETKNCINVASLANNVEYSEFVFLDKVLTLLNNSSKKYIFLREDRKCDQGSCIESLNDNFNKSFNDINNQYIGSTKNDRGLLKSTLNDLKPKIKVGNIVFENPKDDCLSYIAKVQDLKLTAINNSNIALSAVEKATWITQKDDLVSSIKAAVNKENSIIIPSSSTLNEANYGECAKVMYFYKESLVYDNSYFINIYKSIDSVNSKNNINKSTKNDDLKNQFRKEFSLLNSEPEEKLNKVLVEYGYKKN